MSDRASVVIDGIETIGLHNGLYRISFYALDAKGQPKPAVEIVAGADTMAEVLKGLQQLGLPRR